jgi:hypothetical protein
MKKLTLEQMKTILGGSYPGGTVCASSSTSCTYYESGTGNVTGHCEENSKGDCVCHAEHSSIVSYELCGAA